MNILFLLKTLGVGGVEVVTATLANKFADEGHDVSIFAREYRENNLSNRLSPKIHVYIGHGDNDGKRNVNDLHDVYVKGNVQIVVNQWGLPYKPIRLARKAEKGHRVKVISFHHNDPSANGKLNSVDMKIRRTHNPLKLFLLRIQRLVYRFITSSSMRYTYKHSDRFVVLSESYLEHLREFIRVPCESKQCVLMNPVTIDKGNFVYSSLEKKKEIIFCGRMDNIQKCPRRILDVWEKLSDSFSDWSLRFVGDGPDKKSIEEESQKRELKNVFFEGFQNPIEYYKNSSILVMTSDFEGFPLVLAECMSFGVVPCVYDSFAAVHDIIEDDVNGLIIEKENGNFSAEKMATRLAEIMSDEQKLDMMAQKLIETSKRYSIDSVYEQWMENLTQLMKKD